MKNEAKSRKVEFLEQVIEDGVLVKTRKIERVPKEPFFIKLYLKDLALIRELPAWVTGILYELLKKMDYRNEIVLNSTIKNRMATELSIHPKTIDNALLKFTTKNILIRQGKGVFLGNPYLFGRGFWSEVEEIRMTVVYRANGDKDVETDVINDTMLSYEQARREQVAEEQVANQSSCLAETLQSQKEHKQEVLKHTRIKAAPSKKKKLSLSGIESLFETEPAN